jgi:hypothetical protein
MGKTCSGYNFGGSRIDHHIEIGNEFFLQPKKKNKGEFVSEKFDSK